MRCQLPTSLIDQVIPKYTLYLRIYRCQLSIPPGMLELLSHCFLVQFLLTSLRSMLGPEEIRKLEMKELGFQVEIFSFFSLTCGDIAFCCHQICSSHMTKLVQFPYLIVESMIMDLHVEQLARLFCSIPKLRVLQ